MKSIGRGAGAVLLLVLGASACSDLATSPSADAAKPALASGAGGGGAGGGGTVKVDQIKVSKCFWNSAGEMLIKASSSDPSARLFAYKPDGTLIGEVQNGGGSRYGGTVMPYTAIDPVNVTIRSSAGGSTTVPTTPFQI